MSDEEIKEESEALADIALDVLSTPIRGVPSIRIISMENAKKLLSVAYEDVIRRYSGIDSKEN